MNIKQTIIAVVAIFLVGVLFLNYWDNDKQIALKVFKSQVEEKYKGKTQLDLWYLGIDKSKEFGKEKFQFDKEQKYRQIRNLMFFIYGSSTTIILSLILIFLSRDKKVEVR